jgi:hypothetical protein
LDANCVSHDEAVNDKDVVIPESETSVGLVGSMLLTLSDVTQSKYCIK